MSFGEALKDIVLALVGAAGLWQFILWLLNRRANQRKAEAEAEVQVANAAIAYMGVEKAEVDNERSLVAGAGELTQHALNLLEVYRKDNEATRAESEKMAVLNRELLAQNKETQQRVDALQNRVTGMELVVADMATGLYIMSKQLEDAGITPGWKPILALDQMEKALTPDVFKAVLRLFK